VVFRKGLPAEPSTYKQQFVYMCTLPATKTVTLTQGRNEVRWRPGKTQVWPCLNLRSFGSKCTVLKKVLVILLGLFGAPRSHSAPRTVIRRPGNCAPLHPFRYAPALTAKKFIPLQVLPTRFLIARKEQLRPPRRRALESKQELVRPFKPRCL